MKTLVEPWMDKKALKTLESFDPRTLVDGFSHQRSDLEAQKFFWYCLRKFVDDVVVVSVLAVAKNFAAVK